jgi:hypothetical protein
MSYAMKPLVITTSGATPSVNIKTEQYQQVDTCRACLHENAELKSMDENNLRFTYKEFTTIEVSIYKYNDEILLPICNKILYLQVPDTKNSKEIPKLCNECCDVLNFFKNFKEKCLKSNEYFNQLSTSEAVIGNDIDYNITISLTSNDVADETTPIKIKEESNETMLTRNRLKIETVIIDPIDELIEIAPVDAPDKNDDSANKSVDEDAVRVRKAKKSKRDPGTVKEKVKKDKKSKTKKDKKKKDDKAAHKSDNSDIDGMRNENDEDGAGLNSDDNFEDGADSGGGSDTEFDSQFPKKKKKRKMIIDENGEKVYSAQWLAVVSFFFCFLIISKIWREL